jgi:hypothetical protein
MFKSKYSFKRKYFSHTRLKKLEGKNYQIFFRSKCFFVCFELDKCVSLEEPSPAVKVEMNVFDVTEFRKLVSYILFLNSKQLLTSRKSNLVGTNVLEKNYKLIFVDMYFTETLL